MSQAANKFLAAALAVLPLSFCAQGEAEEAEFALDELVVTATRVQDKDINTAAAVEVIGASRIEESGAGNAFEVLQHALGVTTLAQGPGGFSMGSLVSKIQLRGVDKGTLVLVDGVALNQDGKYNLEDIPAELIERIEVVRGGGAVLYGSEATGGVVNIITKKDFAASSVKAAAGSFARRRYAAHVGAGKLALVADYQQRGKISDYADIAGDIYSYQQGEQKNVSWTYRPDAAWTLKQYYAQNEHKVLGRRQGLAAAGNEFKDTDNKFVAQYNKNGWKASAAYGTQEKNYDYLHYKDGAYVRTQNASWRKGHNLELDVQKEWEPDEGDTLLVGAAYKREDLDLYSDSVYKSARYRSNYKRDVYSLYASYGWQATEKTRVNFNARETWAVHNSGWQEDLSTAEKTLSTKNVTSVDNSGDKCFTPELQLLQKLTESSALYFKAGKSFRLPNLTQLYGSGALQPQLDLRPESGVHYEIGYKADNERDAWRIALFKYALKDAITYKSGSSEQNNIVYDNKSLKNVGVEVAYSVRHNADLSSEWGAAWSNPRLGGSERSDTAWVDMRSKLQLSGRVKYQQEKFFAQLAANYVGGIRGNDASETKLRPQLFTDAHFAYAPTQQQKFFLHVNNLLDRRDLTNAGAQSVYDYITNTSSVKPIRYYTPGRNFLLGCEFSF